MGTAHLLTDTALKAAAARRATKLRAQMMLVDIDDPHALALAERDSGRHSSPHASPAKGAAMEGRTRRHLRVAAMTS